jgi:thiol-disulfide isomerase/thioredoxin
LVFSIVLANGQWAHAQKPSVKWLNFEQLEMALKVQTKPIYIDFYADWCVYCKKMDKAAYQDPEVVKLLNTNYYAVKMNAEATDSIRFGGSSFKNSLQGKSRRPTHDLPLLLGQRDGKPFSLPLIVIFNEDFQISKRYFEYISPKRMRAILED